MKTIIRYPKQSDWKSLWEYINTLSQEKTYVSYQGEKVSQNEEKQYLKNMLQRIQNKQSIQLVVESNEKIVGSAAINTQPRCEDHVGIIGISILDPYRNQGLGKQLLTQLIAETKENMPQVMICLLHVMGHNNRALHVYEQLGFKECGRIKQGIRHQGILVDNVLMSLTIR